MGQQMEYFIFDDIVNSKTHFCFKTMHEIWEPTFRYITDEIF